jgi:hypothetical protein
VLTAQGIITETLSELAKKLLKREKRVGRNKNKIRENP